MEEEPATRNTQRLLRPKLRSAILSPLPYSITQSEPNGQAQGEGILSHPQWKWMVKVKDKGAPQKMMYNGGQCCTLPRNMCS